MAWKWKWKWKESSLEGLDTAIFSLLFFVFIFHFFIFFSFAGHGILHKTDGQRTYRHHHFPNGLLLTTIFFSVSSLLLFSGCFYTVEDLLLDSTAACCISSTKVGPKKSKKDMIIYTRARSNLSLSSVQPKHSFFYLLFLGPFASHMPLENPVFGIWHLRASATAWAGI